MIIKTAQRPTGTLGVFIAALRRRVGSAAGRAILKASVLPVAVILGGVIVMGGSQAAFSGTTESPDNSWKAATVGLTSNRATAMFNVAAMKPGMVESRCITITSTSDVPTEVRLYSGGVTGSNGINTYLTLTAEAGAGGIDTGSVCTGFTTSSSLFTGAPAEFAAKNSFAAGLPGSTLQPGGSQQYRITVTLLTTAPNSAQGGQSSIGFTWENQ